MRVLITGGARSGKSGHAVRLLEEAGAVTFVAPGRPPGQLDDPDWAQRVAHHRAHRPETWETVESADLPAVLAATPGPVLVDCLGTWITATVDALDLWEAPTDEAREVIDQRAGELCRALVDHDNVVLVTNEVGSGVVPEHRSGALFRDLLGAVNQAVGEVCDEVHLVVCGRVLRL